MKKGLKTQLIVLGVFLLNHASFSLELKGSFGVSSEGTKKYYFNLISPSVTKIDEIVTKLIFDGENRLHDLFEICFIDVKVFYLPKDFRSIQKDKITKFVVRRTGLKEISNLNIFPNLKKLEISGNALTAIEQNSFVKNTFLVELNLSGNQIADINANSFINLDKLNVLNLRSNQCINVILHPRADIVKNVDENLKKCSVNVFSELQKSEILETKTEIENVQQLNKKMLLNLTDAILRLENKLNDLEKESKKTVTTTRLNNATRVLTNSTQNSSSSVIYIQTFIIAFFIIFIIVGCIILYVNRSNIVVMRGAYKLPDDAEMNILTENLCKIENNNEVKFQNASKEIAILPLLHKPLSPIKPLKAPVARLKPNLTLKMPVNLPESLSPKETKLEVLHSKHPNITPRMIFDEVKSNVDYDEIWNALDGDEKSTFYGKVINKKK